MYNLTKLYHITNKISISNIILCKMSYSVCFYRI
nr:MAG TPA: hypothetical protein [Bacteriophage sp.]